MVQSHIGKKIGHPDSNSGLLVLTASTLCLPSIHSFDKYLLHPSSTLGPLWSTGGIAINSTDANLCLNVQGGEEEGQKIISRLNGLHVRWW